MRMGVSKQCVELPGDPVIGGSTSHVRAGSPCHNRLHCRARGAAIKAQVRSPGGPPFVRKIVSQDLTSVRITAEVRHICASCFAGRSPLVPLWLQFKEPRVAGQTPLGLGAYYFFELAIFCSLHCPYRLGRKALRFLDSLRSHCFG